MTRRDAEVKNRCDTGRESLVDRWNGKEHLPRKTACPCSLQFCFPHFLDLALTCFASAATVTTPSLYRPIRGYRFQHLLSISHVPVQHFPEGIQSCIFVAATSGHTEQTQPGVFGCLQRLDHACVQGQIQPTHHPDPPPTVHGSVKAPAVCNGIHSRRQNSEKTPLARGKDTDTHSDTLLHHGQAALETAIPRLPKPARQALPVSPWTVLMSGATAPRLQNVLSRPVLSSKPDAGRTSSHHLLKNLLLASRFAASTLVATTSSAGASTSTGTSSPDPGPTINKSQTNRNPSTYTSPPNSLSRTFSASNLLAWYRTLPSPYFNLSGHLDDLSSLIRPFLAFLDPSSLSSPYSMASTSYAFSTSSGSDFSTPRSSSPHSSASVASARSSHSSTFSAGKRLSMSSVRRTSASNPMSSVDLSTIEEALKMANLDTMKGYCQKTYGEVHQETTTEYISQEEARGYQVLNQPHWNKVADFRISPKGTSFTPEERVAKNLTGLIPHVMEDSEKQVERALKMIRTRQTDIDRYLYLSTLKSQNVDLFYRLLMDHAKEMMPLVYTPTIGDVCLQYSTLYTRPEALYISIKQRKSIRTILRNWPYPQPEICVVTDGSRILGLGDLGVNGVGIPIGKLALYTAAAGIHPDKTLPIVLDCGTANETNLKDPLYLGLRQKRIPVAEQQEFMDEFMEAAAEVFPDMVVQFEDFESEKAFNYLDRYRDQYKCFNDDIQGTGAVVLAGYIGAVNLSNVPIEEQRLVFMGAGSAGVGVAKQLVEYYTKRGLSEQQAKDKFWLVDTKGLVTKDRGDKLAEHKKYFARTDNNGHQFRTLEEVIEYVKPSALVGLTATHGVFTESVVRALKASVDAGGLGRRPILFPLSNPLTKAECTFKEAIDWTDGTVLFASGSPFSSYTTNGVTYHPNQGNNVYVFPGIGLGAILAKATRVTDDMIYTSAAALANSLNADEVKHGLIYPRIDRVREASVIVAREVMKSARREGVSTLPEEQWLEWEEWGDVDLERYIKQHIYDPKF
ncbi:hypothetical protein B0T13DRAFT_487702 [Neurospora crassa]|nr:hypothetical protein B0T13DRAFT_487702 [Neurospora crassa]